MIRDVFTNKDIVQQHRIKALNWHRQMLVMEWETDQDQWETPVIKNDKTTCTGQATETGPDINISQIMSKNV